MRIAAATSPYPRCRHMSFVEQPEVYLEAVRPSSELGLLDVAPRFFFERPTGASRSGGVGLLVAAGLRSP
jgi:hypothetical protein